MEPGYIVLIVLGSILTYIFTASFFHGIAIKRGQTRDDEYFSAIIWPLYIIAIICVEISKATREKKTKLPKATIIQK